jgi:pyruvate carboxylase
MAAATSNERAVEDVFEEGEAPKQAQSIHRIRANSTIMQLSKILGESIAVCEVDS